MKKSFFYLILFAIVLVGCQVTGSKTFTSDEGGFSVSFPGSPAQDAQNVNTPVGAIVMHTFLLDKSDYAYMVAYSDYPESLVSQTPTGMILSGARDGAVANVQGRLVSETFISLQGYLGREMIIEAPASEAFARVRIYLAGNRMYQIMALTSTEQETQADKITSYLNSFMIIE